MPRRSRPTRSGIATLEFVLVWPLLLMLCAGLVLVSRAGVAKEAAATRARDRAFAARGTGDPGEALLAAHDPLDSEISGAGGYRTAPGPLFRAAEFRAESRSLTIDRTWDDRDVPFAPAGDWKVHPGPFKQIAKNVPGGGAFVAVVNGAALIMNAGANPVLLAAAAVGAVLNPVVRAAGTGLEIITGTLLLPAKLILKAIAAVTPSWTRFGKKVRRAIKLIELLIDAGANLSNASQGKPVADPTDLGRLRLP